MPKELIVRNAREADDLMAIVRTSARRAQEWMSAQSDDPLALLRRMKFDQVGFHPLEGRPLNLIEQVNQTRTFAVAITAARQLLVLHPDAGGLRLAPGAHASLELDIMSEVEGYVGAETFAVVSPRNNGKLAADLAKLARRSERYRYIFFMSPLFPSMSAGRNSSGTESRCGQSISDAGE
ncbi:hypothetical protein NKH28_30570 [Mesorhizobium sp. M1227]|uniref:hypothetical protein n=1 Tax=Mesorhizobium sp. M1227 TaxID=2957071 RepID=UPI003336AA70